MIKWGTDFSDNYNYGARIELLKNDFVRFSSPFMPAGTPIKVWQSKTEYHADRKSPMLPILMNGKEYRIVLEAEFDNADAGQLTIEFFDVNQDLIDKVHFQDLTGNFTYPENAVTYKVQLVNKKHEYIIFKYLLIFSEPLKEQYDFKFNKNLSVFVFKAKHSYEGLKTTVIVLKNSKHVTSLEVDEYRNYFFLLGNEVESEWLETATYVVDELQDISKSSPIMIKRGPRFKNLDHKNRSFPYILKEFIPRSKMEELPTKTAHSSVILKEKVFLNQYVTTILQIILSKKKKDSQNSVEKTPVCQQTTNNHENTIRREE
ncbi:accessory Sec system protein Asp3 [Enterococcus raffinosus]|uniref:accessory Sec system protein Asp3 n=1 Tax=Enterococcus raffinosus TaxID=71452 RepID=UPI001C9792E4|nr:accessory Sec system protein Asp3 [Enterococcus raffinosus]QZO10889.1 accessory Sec system protein Asp3 [Enterococcus raffinosus]